MVTSVTQADVADRAPLSQRRVLLVIGGLLLGMLLASLDQTIVATALPTIVSDLGGLTQLSWVVTAYLLASTASTPLWGKLGDLFGRKRLFQVAIAIFLVGSALSGLSQNMIELIAFRAVQGLGAGGLLVTAQALVADIVPPRERGQYQGLFGVVFGVTSVVGPLLGGLLVQSLSWRWVFYVNLPIGVIALVVTALVLPPSSARGRVVVDYLGTVLIAGAATSLILLTTLGGNTYPWISAPIGLLLLLGLALMLAFVLVERRAAEPVMPLRLFRNRVFSVTSTVGFIVGFAMFGGITFLPLYLQVVKGVSPTSSGLRLLPLMAGLLLTSTVSGQFITRWGRYKVFPIVGTAVMALGLFLLSRMDEHTSTLTSSLAMLVLGLGLGLVMQVLVIAVQNAVDFRDLGVATSGATFFRSIGSSFGVAIFGAIFSSALAANLRAAFPPGTEPPGVGAGSAGGSPSTLQHLPPALHALYVHAFAISLQPVFLSAFGVAVVAFALTWLLQEVPLRATATASDPGQGYAMPAARTSREEIERALFVLVSREGRGSQFRRLAALAGLPLTPATGWLLCQIGQTGPTTAKRLSVELGLPLATLQPLLAELVQAGFLASAPPGDDRHVTDDATLTVTPVGRQARDQLIGAQRADLEGLLAGWPAADEAELAALLTCLAERLLTDDRGGRLPSDGASTTTRVDAAPTPAEV